jgi:hypothetical protein
MIANIALDDGLILPHSANPTGSNFRERQPVQSAYNDARSTCHRECGLKPWQLNPLSVHGSQTEPRAIDTPESWRRAQELRAALLQAAGLEPEGE